MKNLFVLLSLRRSYLKFFEIIIASPPDREEQVAEVWYKNELWAEISEETIGQFMIQFYNQSKNDYWEFSYKEAIEALEKAKNRLAEMKRIDNEEYRKKMGLDD